MAGQTLTTRQPGWPVAKAGARVPQRPTWPALSTRLAGRVSAPNGSGSRHARGNRPIRCCGPDFVAADHGPPLPAASAVFRGGA